MCSRVPCGQQLGKADRGRGWGLACVSLLSALALDSHVALGATCTCMIGRRRASLPAVHDGVSAGRGGCLARHVDWHGCPHTWEGAPTCMETVALDCQWARWPQARSAAPGVTHLCATALLLPGTPPGCPMWQVQPLGAAHPVRTVLGLRPEQQCVTTRRLMANLSA